MVSIVYISFENGNIFIILLIHIVIYMTPIEATVIVFPMIIINLTILLFFASRSKDKLDKINDLKAIYISQLSGSLSILSNRIDQEHLDEINIVDEMNNLLKFYHELNEFWCDYNYKCNVGILRNLAFNFLFIIIGWILLVITTFITGDSTIFWMLAGASLLWAIYHIGCGIYKVIKEGALLNEFETRLGVR